MSSQFAPRWLPSIGRVSVVTVGQVAVPFVVLLAWQLAAMALSGGILATPAATFGALVNGLTQEEWLVTHLRESATAITIGYLLAVVTGITFGVVIGLNEVWEEALEPAILGMYSIPKITLFPIFLFIFQIGLENRIAFGWFHGVFPITIITLNSINSVRDVHLKVGRSLRLSPFRMFRHVIFPSILPNLVIALQLGFSLTFIGVIIGEMFASRAGLGNLLLRFMALNQVARMMAICVAIIILVAGVNALFFVAQKRMEARSEGDLEIRL